MNPSLASLVYACGIAGLFYLDRDKSVRTSKALWLPVVYLWILGSRPVSTWLGITPAYGSNAQLEGTPFDAVFFAMLSIAAMCVVVHRGRRTLTALTANSPILIYFFFCLLSVSWSDFPDVSLKRWIKAIGDLAMILIVVTEEQPVAALRRLLARTGLVLIPISLLFIKYYPELGRTYESWSGAMAVTGVTQDKNMLGLITFVLSLGAVWRVLGLLWSDEIAPHRRRHLLAQGTLLVLGGLLLKMANSATAIVSFVLGAGLLLAMKLRFMKRNPAAVHVLVLLLVLSAGVLTLLGGQTHAAHALGRNSNLTGRTDIWRAVIPMTPNPLIGAGFESFWLSPAVHQKLAEVFPNLPLNEAHNGYVEVYLELGWVGVGLIGILLVDGYRRSVKAFRRDPSLAGLLIAYILSAMVYNFTEAGFRMLDLMWIFFLLAVLEASIVAAGVGVGLTQPLDAGADTAPDLLALRASHFTIRRATLNIARDDRKRGDWKT